MALWKDNVKPSPSAEPREMARPDPPAPSAPFLESSPPKPSAAPRSDKESMIASDLTIEGKIAGAGSLRLAGRFKGDVDVSGDLTVEQGARLNGSVRANKVIVAGELEGNIEAAARVELLEGGSMIGDLKAGIVTIVAGARMRGNVEFGWEDGRPAKPGKPSTPATGKPDSPTPAARFDAEPGESK
jgi:cytoskeletal protein CcmA (bactofilin family)